MSNEPAFRCPVCRASQPLQTECRRCKADLSLVVRARRRLAYLLSQREAASCDQALAERIEAEIKLLDPTHDATGG